MTQRGGFPLVGGPDCIILNSMKSLVSTLIAAIALLAGLFASAAVKADQPVDVALVLAVDVSRSMSAEELAIQRDGYAAAIAHPSVIRAVEQGLHGRIALTMFEWANDAHVREIVPWTLIETPQDAEDVSTIIREDQTIGQRRTSISGAIRYASKLLLDVPYQADRLVIDISGDGPNNQGSAVTRARDLAVEAGFVINGLPLMTTGGFGGQFNIPDLDEYYRRCVIGGPGSFVIPVNDWAQFPEAVRRKLVLEIGGRVPEEPARVFRAQITFGQPYDCMVGEKMWRNLRERFFLDP
ncbi:DUF1194 domain-containing protein [Roseibium alexandrii]|uniref:DUF1194 domain-containing protein n=1 Tax=Roseibium alexandrii TaxID=388408 RepID=UPI003753989A